MKKIVSTAIASFVVAAAGLAMVSPAAAQKCPPSCTPTNQDRMLPVPQDQNRRAPQVNRPYVPPAQTYHPRPNYGSRPYYGGGPYYNRPYYNSRPYYHRRYDDDGAGVAAAIIGGAIIGSAITQNQANQRYYDDTYEEEEVIVRRPPPPKRQVPGAICKTIIKHDMYGKPYEYKDCH